MSAILSAVAQWHRDNAELSAIIPAANVVAGEPEPGMALPAIGYREVTLGTRGGTSKARFRQIVCTAIAEATDAETLEELAEQLERSMYGWQSDRYRTIGPPTVEATISRQQEHPSENYQATYRLAWTAVAEPL